MNTPDFINELVENGLDNNTIIDHVQTQQNRINDLEQALHDITNLHYGWDGDCGAVSIANSVLDT